MLLEKYPHLKGLILDMDGVLWHVTRPIGDLPKLFNDIEAMGLKVVFATNNSTKSIADYVSKLAGFGIHATPEQIITSAETTGRHLQKNYARGSLVYVVGAPALAQTLADKGFGIASEETYQQASIVVVGLDTGINYEKIRNAELLIRSGAAFIATNDDATLPSPHGLYPGAGVMVKAISTAAGKEATVLGKPRTAMYEEAFEILGTAPTETMGVGDRLETDIASAQNAGCLSGLVLSGASTRAEADAWQPAPDLIAKDLSALIYG